MGYTRQNSTILYQPADPNGRFLEAVVWGSWAKAKAETILDVWESKQRRVETRAMIAILLNESAGSPYIFRYEMGLNRVRPDLTEFDCTSVGMYQILGANVKPYGYSTFEPMTTGNLEEDLDVQMWMFDDFYAGCIKTARQSVYVSQQGYNAFYVAAHVYNAGHSGVGTEYCQKWLANYRLLKDMDREATIKHMKLYGMP